MLIGIIFPTSFCVKISHLCSLVIDKREREREREHLISSTINQTKDGSSSEHIVERHLKVRKSNPQHRFSPLILNIFF